MFSKHGVINNVLMSLGVVSAPIQLLYSSFAVVIGVVYSYLPFMVLPLYASLIKNDRSLLEASSDLGCRPLKSFMTVTLPLSAPGMVAGSLLVFVPVMGEYVIPELLGGTNSLMIGRIIWDEFFINRDWPVASAVAIALVVLLVLPIMIFQRFQTPSSERVK
jgi:putrescine transport system permease protein